MRVFSIFKNSKYFANNLVVKLPIRSDESERKLPKLLKIQLNFQLDGIIFLFSLYKILQNYITKL